MAATASLATLEAAAPLFEVVTLEPP